MDFGTEDPLAEHLRQGEFSILMEVDTPPRTQPFKSAVAIGEAVARQCRNWDCVTGLSVTDRLTCEDAHDPVDTAKAVGEAGGKPILMHISGKGSDTKRVRDLLARASSPGIRNVLAVTGDRSDKHPRRRGFGRFPHHPAGYLDSVDIVKTAAKGEPAFHVGGAINPFKYNPADQYLQFYKLLRKLACGAEFVMTQTGWDMKKLQELQWFLQMREVDVPVIARLALLSPDDIHRLHEGIVPGVMVSREFCAMLQRESAVNEEQSLAGQLRRIALQVTGCRLLGYSGVQISRIRDEQTAKKVLSSIDAAMQDITSYGDWVAAWKDFHSDVNFAPIHEPYYVFANLLTPELQWYNAEQALLTEQAFPGPQWSDRVRSRLLGIFLADTMPAPVRRGARSLVCRKCREESCGLERCFYLCPYACPKGLSYGACGGTAPDGTCEFGHATCFFHRVLAVAAQRHASDRLEEAL